MELSQLQAVARSFGYEVREEDTSYLDSTPVYALYRNNIFIRRFQSIVGCYNYILSIA